MNCFYLKIVKELKDIKPETCWVNSKQLDCLSEFQYIQRINRLVKM